ncbi:MAG: VOC family protein [Myxococcales bacterium]|nr:VOC family protein [Myxococcales bacterium]
MASHHHHIDFIELPVTDITRAKAFYSEVFGWSFVDYGPEYADIQAAGVSGGLRASSTPPTRGGALVILYSTDLAASEAAVVAAGATVTSHHEFPGGKRFQFLDPAGNELGVWTAVEPG